MLTRIGILGCGKIARHHAAALQAAGASIVAGCSRRADSPSWQAFKAVAPGVRFAGDGERLLADNDVEGLVACLPWHEMPKWTARLLECPKPILLEKPLALDADVLDRTIGGAPSSDNKVVGYNRRFYAPVRRLAERLRQGGLKAVYAAISEDLGHHVANQGEAVLPHVFAFSSAHSLDLLLHLLGPLRVKSMYRYGETGYPQPFQSCNGVLETAEGRPVFLALNADDPVAAGIRFLFDDGTSWLLSPLECLQVYRGYDIVQEAANTAIRRYTPRRIETVEEPATLKPGFLAQAKAFLAGDRAVAAKPRDSVTLLRLIEAVSGGPHGLRH